MESSDSVELSENRSGLTMCFCLDVLLEIHPSPHEAQGLLIKSVLKMSLPHHDRVWLLNQTQLTRAGQLSTKTQVA